MIENSARITTTGVVGKRVFDLSAAILGLLVLSPLFLVAALAIKLDSRGPVFFRQRRVGRHGVEFRIFKFRSMTVGQDAAAPGITALGDARITRVGGFLRRYKIDELPQLLNVVGGDMSFVGPRPELPKYVAMYPAETRDIVLSVRPGITDYAAIEFRNESALLADAKDPERVYVDRIMPRKLELYVQYVSDQSLWLDLRLIVKTLFAL